jgi:hypothetical protein
MVGSFGLKESIDHEDVLRPSIKRTSKFAYCHDMCHVHRHPWACVFKSSVHVHISRGSYLSLAACRTSIWGHQYSFLVPFSQVILPFLNHSKSFRRHFMSSLLGRNARSVRTCSGVPQEIDHGVFGVCADFPPWKFPFFTSTLERSLKCKILKEENACLLPVLGVLETLRLRCYVLRSRREQAYEISRIWVLQFKKRRISGW